MCIERVKYLGFLFVIELGNQIFKGLVTLAYKLRRFAVQNVHVNSLGPDEVDFSFLHNQNIYVDLLCETVVDNQDRVGVELLAEVLFALHDGEMLLDEVEIGLGDVAC
jgi:hypothetical protein